MLTFSTLHVLPHNEDMMLLQESGSRRPACLAKFSTEMLIEKIKPLIQIS